MEGVNLSMMSYDEQNKTKRSHGEKLPLVISIIDIITVSSTDFSVITFFLIFDDSFITIKFSD